jgi:hypothetical protein
VFWPLSLVLLLPLAVLLLGVAGDVPLGLWLAFKVRPPQITLFLFWNVLTTGVVRLSYEYSGLLKILIIA